MVFVNAEMTSARVQDFLAAAADLLDQAGVEGVSLRNVAAAVGVSHNAPYRHFASKQDLLEALIARELASMCEQAQQQEALPSLRTLSLVFAQWALQYPERFRLVIQQWPHGNRDDLRGSMQCWDEMYASSAAALLARSAHAQGFSAQKLGYLIRSTTLGALQHHLAAGGSIPAPQQIIDELFNYLYAALRLKP